MALNNIKNLRKESGFTIVELLIVIVVIAILATISIVAYSGIQTRAKATKAQANASQVQKIAEAYYADNSVYPTTVAHFTGNATAKLPSNVTLLTGTQTLSSSSENQIMYRYIGSGAGACAMYWDFGAATPAASAPILMGTATAATCNSTTGTMPA